MSYHVFLSKILPQNLDSKYVFHLSHNADNSKN